MRRAAIEAGAASAVALIVGLYTFVLDRQVPLINLVDLGFHELGHLLTYPFPDMVTAAMGSGMQVLVPLGLAGYFGWWRKELPQAGVCVMWAAESLHNVAIYIADAPYEELPLLGNGLHDWAYLLGPEQFDRLDLAGPLATLCRVIGALMLIAAMGLAAWHVRRAWQADQPPPPPRPSLRGRIRVW